MRSPPRSPVPTDLRLVRNSKCGSYGVAEGHHLLRLVKNEEGVPRFEGYTAEFFAVEAQVRAEDFEREPPQLQTTAGLRVHFRFRSTN